MDLNAGLEEKLKNEAIKYLDKARPNWDIPHTMATVYWMKKLLVYEEGDPKILISTMYLHDIGGANILNKKNLSFESQEQLKQKQMDNGIKLSKIILSEIREYSTEEIEKIVYLVGTHDNLDKITSSPDGQLVFEADSLGQINVDRVTPTFSKKDYIRFLDFFEKEKASRFKTKAGKKFLSKLLQRAKQYCKEMS